MLTELSFLDRPTASSPHCKRCSHHGPHFWTAAASEVLQRICPCHWKPVGVVRLTSNAAMLQVALQWFCSRSLMHHEGLTKELIDRIPGKQTDRKTALGELNWIFTAITDTIAWNMLPRALFQRLFRQVRAEYAATPCRA